MDCASRPLLRAQRDGGSSEAVSGASALHGEPPMKWAYRALLALGVVCVVCLAGAIAVSSRGSFERVAPPVRDALNSSSTLWHVCLSREPRKDRTLINRCVRVRGTLLHVWRKHDAQGALSEVHLLLAAHFHLYVVKVLPPFPSRLGVGHQVTVVGPLVHPHPEYLNIHEVEAFSLTAGTG